MVTENINEKDDSDEWIVDMGNNTWFSPDITLDGGIQTSKNWKKAKRSF